MTPAARAAWLDEARTIEERAKREQRTFLATERLIREIFENPRFLSRPAVAHPSQTLS
jgi:hypothetical protein